MSAVEQTDLQTMNKSVSNVLVGKGNKRAVRLWRYMVRAEKQE